MTATATCQCGKVPDRPCSAAITQEDLLCDQCRASLLEGMTHIVFSWLTLSGPVPQHYAVPVKGVDGFFSMEAS